MSSEHQYIQHWVTLLQFSCIRSDVNELVCTLPQLPTVLYVPIMYAGISWSNKVCLGEIQASTPPSSYLSLMYTKLQGNKFYF